MQSLESIFVREFREAVKDVGYKDIYKVPLPECVSGWYVSGTEMYGVQGVEKEYYRDLNMSFVRRLPRGMVAKRRSIDKVTRDFKRNENGEYIYEEYKTPTGSVVVLSDKKISLPYSEYVKPIEGYGYIDFATTNKGIEYMYVLPKSVLYKVNQTALVLSVKDMKDYSGMGYVTWTMGKIFLHIVPYNPNSQYTGSKVLKTGYSLDYTKEIKNIVDYWQQVGMIPNIAACQLQDESNLVMKPTVIGYDEYNPMEALPLSDKEIYGGSEGISG